MIKKHNMGWAWLSLVMFGILGISIKLQAAWISWFDDLGANLMPRVTWANSTIFETIANLGSPTVSLLIAVLAGAFTWREFRTQAVLFDLAQFGGAGLLLGIKMLFSGLGQCIRCCLNTASVFLVVMFLWQQLRF